MPSWRRIVPVAAPRHVAVAILTAVATLGARPRPLTAQPDLVTAQLFVDPNFSGGTGPNDQTVNGLGHLFIGGSATGGFIGNVVPSGDGSVDVTEGRVKLFASAFASTNTVARGIFRDALTFTSPVLPTGTLVTVRWRIGMDGLLQINAPPAGVGQASWSLQADLGGGAADVSKSGHLGNFTDNVVYTGDPLGTFTGVSTIQLGFAAPLFATFDIAAQAAFDFQGPGDATANFLNTGFWGGIQSVDVGGTPVSYSVTSVSGTDWTRSFASTIPPTTAPEPATWALLGAGLVALGAVRRRRA